MRKRCYLWQRLAGAALVAALTAQAAVPAGAASPDGDWEAVLAPLTAALDTADRDVFLMEVERLIGAPGVRAADVAAAAALLAPWLGPDIAARAVSAHASPETAAAEVLAAVLTALEGRRHRSVLRAVRQAVPAADPVLLDQIEARFAAAVAAGLDRLYPTAAAAPLRPEVAQALRIGGRAVATAHSSLRTRWKQAPLPAAASAGRERPGAGQAKALEAVPQEPALENRFLYPSGS